MEGNVLKQVGNLDTLFEHTICAGIPIRNYSNCPVSNSFVDTGMHANILRDQEYKRHEGGECWLDGDRCTPVEASREGAAVETSCRRERTKVLHAKNLKIYLENEILHSILNPLVFKSMQTGSV